VILVVSAVGALAVGALAAGATALRLKPRRPLLLAAIVVAPDASSAIVLALKLPWQILVVTALVTGFGQPRSTSPQSQRYSRRRACGTCNGSTNPSPGKARSSPSPTEPATLSRRSASQPRQATRQNGLAFFFEQCVARSNGLRDVRAVAP
jgi:hypothetical protein